MSVNIRATASALQEGDAAVVNRGGDPAAVVLGTAAEADAEDFIAADGGTELDPKATPVAEDQVLKARCLSCLCPATKKST
jgi:hypothetical protein